MKKIFILTGEPSGDKLASTVIAKLEAKNYEIKYLSVGGSNLKKLGISSIFDLKSKPCIRRASSMRPSGEQRYSIRWIRFI